MGLSRKMDHRVATVHGLGHRGSVANISPHKLIARISADGFELCQISRVCQFVVINYIVFIGQRENMTDEIRPNKTRPACNEYLHAHPPFSLCMSAIHEFD